ncbi:MAG: YceI family protein [Opitutales bacterium]
MLPEPGSITFQDVASVKNHIDAGAPVTVLDIRSSEAFDLGHIPTAQNACVYEVAFLDKVKERVPDPSTSVIVYGENATFRAAEVAAYRLQRAGYKEVVALQGGLAAWRTVGGPVEGSDPKDAQELAPPPPADGVYGLVPDTGIVRWVGRNPLNQHHGSIPLKSGTITIEHGRLFAGEVVIDMESLAVGDIEDPDMNGLLVSHLKHEDFFDVENYPEARCALMFTDPMPDTPPGQPNTRIKANVTIRGVTQPETFDALIIETAKGVAFQAVVDLDRTRYNVLYGTGKLFERLGMHLVNDRITLQIHALFQPQAGG